MPWLASHPLLQSLGTFVQLVLHVLRSAGATVLGRESGGVLHSRDSVEDVFHIKPSVKRR
jgi:hypothetical protein